MITFNANRVASPGFSLVEVVLAIGIIGFAFVAILGVVPVGLNNFNRSIETTVNARIVQRLVSTVQQCQSQDLVSLPKDHYFDGEGLPAKDSNFVYHARIIIDFKVYLPLDQQWEANQKLRQVLIHIAKNMTVDQAETAGPGRLSTFGFVAADAGL